MEKVKITFYALLATALALAIFFAVIKIAAVLSVVLLLLFVGTIIFYATKYWPRK